MQFFINYKFFPAAINEILVFYDPESIIYSKNAQKDEYIFEAVSLYDEFPFINNKDQLEAKLNVIMIDSFTVFPKQLTPEDYKKQAYLFEDEMINQLWKIKKRWMRMQP